MAYLDVGDCTLSRVSLVELAYKRSPQRYVLGRRTSDLESQSDINDVSQRAKETWLILAYSSACLLFSFL